MNVDYEHSWFLKLRPKMPRGLKGLKRAHLLLERDTEGGPVWRPESDSDKELPPERQSSRSYHLYFILPDGDAFEFTTETEDYIDGSLEKVHGDGQTGWCVVPFLCWRP